MISHVVNPFADFSTQIIPSFAHGSCTALVYKHSLFMNKGS